jgi:DNA replication protein DnaC
METAVINPSCLPTDSTTTPEIQYRDRYKSSEYTVEYRHWLIDEWKRGGQKQQIQDFENQEHRDLFERLWNFDPDSPAFVQWLADNRVRDWTRCTTASLLRYIHQFTEQYVPPAEREARERARVEAARVAKENRRRQTQADREEAWHEVVGPRYRGCTFATYLCAPEAPAMGKALDACREYADMLVTNPHSPNLILFGGCGTGKDHLAVSVCRVLFGQGWKPVGGVYDSVVNHIGWENGAKELRLTTGTEMIAHIRDRMHKGVETNAVKLFTRPDLLVLSDPSPPSGDALTGYQSSVLARVIDDRYRAALPVIVTINCRERVDMNAMLTTPIADRLIDGAVTVVCDWPSHRKSLQRRKD